METGTVVRLKSGNGYGFINSSGSDYFFHCKELSAQLPFDDKLMERVVEFDVSDSEKGKRAVRIRPAF